MVSTWVVVTRTRAFRRLSTAGLAGVTATGGGRKSKSVPKENTELATERHRLAKIADERVSGSSVVPHPPHPRKALSRR
ncbi:MAG TPA: hypothetical protein VHK65_02330 [Candidatus Dormibacteraeota bacterium]|nr:hypothetical protein [Candidatus Dormibacteraeota bacterium]